MPDNKIMPKNRIAELRKGKNLSQAELAEQTGLTRQAISLYEIGKREPKLATWIRLANFFDVPISYLQGVSDLPNKANFKSYANVIDTLNKSAISKLNKSKNTSSIYDPKTLKEVANLLAEREYSSFSLACNAYISKNDTNLTIDQINHYQKIVSKLTASSFIDEANFHTGSVFRMILDAQNGDKKAQKFYKKIQNVINDYLDING